MSALPLDCWISPYSPYQTAASVAAAVAKVHSPGFLTRVLLPTMYGADVQRDLNRTIGNDLAIAGVEDCERVRGLIESYGVPCGGWSVPCAVGDIAEQGYMHGVCAGYFDWFILNFEHGWPGFWSVDGVDIVTQFLDGFWRGIAAMGATARLDGQIGITMVTNTAMMLALDDDELLAWTGGTNYDALEAYVEDDPGLDPEAAIAIWTKRLADVDITGRDTVLILSQGDLDVQTPYYAHPVRGTQIWTLEIAAAHLWPADPPTPPPPPTDNCAPLINALAYVCDDQGDALLAECTRSNVRKTVVRSVVKEMQRVRTETIGPRP